MHYLAQKIQSLSTNDVVVNATMNGISFTMTSVRILNMFHTVVSRPTPDVEPGNYSPQLLNVSYR